MIKLKVTINNPKKFIKSFKLNKPREIYPVNLKINVFNEKKIKIDKRPKKTDPSKINFFLKVNLEINFLNLPLEFLHKLKLKSKWIVDELKEI